VHEFQYCKPRPMHEFQHWLKIANFSHKTPILAFKVIQGHQIRRQSRECVWLPISHRYWNTATCWLKIANFSHTPLI